MTNNTNYSIDYYSFKTGEYIYTDCDNTSWFGGKLMLRFPYLFVSDEPVYEPLQNPEVWFVVRQNNCMVGIDQVNSEISNLEEQILTIEDVESRQKTFVYPNPFDDYLNVYSLIADELIIQNASGKVIYTQQINAGETKLTTSNMEIGFYVLVFKNQNKRFKLIKK